MPSISLRYAQLLQPALRSFVYYRPNVDAALCHLLTQDRLQLPKLSLDQLFDDFEASTVELNELPRGPWSTPLADVVVLLKIVVCSRPRRVLEVGSYRGYTARLMAQHASEDAELVTVDMNPDHGEAYRGSALADRIERRIGKTGPDIFESDAPGTYDLIFLDAGHFYDDVKYDTELLLPLLADDGYLLWHDYANWGYFSGKNGVPEYLHELSESIPIAHIAGSDIAIHCPAWTQQRVNQYESALVSEAGPGDFDPWETKIPRG